MHVQLIEYNHTAVDLLLFTKNTRLGLNTEQWEGIINIDEHEVREQLEYMANTIPSSWEFVSYTFLIEGVSRAFTHQLVRNRHGSYAQESLRVVDKSGYEYVKSERIKNTPAYNSIVDRVNFLINDAYNKLLAMDCPVEDARGILPTNIATNIVARFNLRTLAELAASRSGGRTQDEYRKVMNAMIDEVTKVHPWTELFFFGDRGRDYFAELEAFAEREYGGNLLKKGELLKIVDKMRKQR